LAADSQLWKSAYYDRFVRPRASRLPGIRDREPPAKSLYYSSKISKWLEDDHLVRGGNKTNWERQYKLRHNWSKGRCRVAETQIAERPSTPPLLVCLHGGLVITADFAGGLRAWSVKEEQRLVASLNWPTDGDSSISSSIPTSLAVDVSNSDINWLNFAIGFSDGRFSIYRLDQVAKAFIHRYTHAPSSNGTISAIAYASRYLLTMTEAQLLSLYIFSDEATGDEDNATLEPPRLLSSLKSQTAWPPLSLAIRVPPNSIFASIAYAIPTYLAGWSVGLQELRLTMDGRMVESRLACALSQGFTPLSISSPPSSGSSPRSGSSPVRSSGFAPKLPSTRPTSLSYTHPYILAAHPDNTLTLYMVTSNAKILSIKPGERLWGHTSSVSGAHVGDRGKAVSVSAHGNEIRVWDLEGGFSSNSSKRRVATGEASVQVRPERRKDSRTLEYEAYLGCSESSDPEKVDLDESAVTKGWVAFDDEKVVVLREKTHGSQNLVVYDFT